MSEAKKLKLKSAIALLSLAVFVGWALSQFFNSQEVESIHQSEAQASVEIQDSGEKLGNQTDSQQTNQIEQTKNQEISESGIVLHETVFEGDVFLSEDRMAFQRIAKAEFEYPLIAIQEIWNISPADPLFKEYVGRREMVADHLLVRIHSLDLKNSFESKVLSMGMKIRSNLNEGDIFLVEFSVDSLEALQNAQKRLLALPEVRSVLPDFMSKGF